LVAFLSLGCRTKWNGTGTSPVQNAVNNHLNAPGNIARISQSLAARFACCALNLKRHVRFGEFMANQLHLLVPVPESRKKKKGAGTEYEQLVKKSKSSKLEDNLFAEFKLYGLPEPVREHTFHPTRKWRFDFAWPDRMIALEIHGGIFVRGGHARGFGMEEDFEKENEAIRLGWKLYKFGSSQCQRKKQTQQSSAALEYMYGILKPEDRK
jgi:hypothetical protein